MDVDGEAVRIVGKLAGRKQAALTEVHLAESDAVEIRVGARADRAPLFAETQDAGDCVLGDEAALACSAAGGCWSSGRAPACWVGSAHS